MDYWWIRPSDIGDWPIFDINVNESWSLVVFNKLLNTPEVHNLPDEELLFWLLNEAAECA